VPCTTVDALSDSPVVATPCKKNGSREDEVNTSRKHLGFEEVGYFSAI